MNNTEDNALNMFIKVISAILTSVTVIPIFGAMLYTKVFSFKILIFLIMFIITTCIIFKLKNIHVQLILLIFIICGVIYLGHSREPDIPRITEADMITSENILSIDYTSNNSDVLHIGFDNKYYYVFKKNETSTIELIKLPCDDVKIKETDTLQKPTYNYKKLPGCPITDREITVTKGKYKLIKQ